MVIPDTQRYSDVHCHLPVNFFYRQIGTLMDQYQHSGIHLIVSISQEYKETERSLELATKFPEKIIPAMGIHPWKAHKKLQELEVFEELLRQNPNIRVLGEVGLDYHFITQRERYASQRVVFEYFLALGEKFTLPLMLHCKGAEADILEYIESSNLPGSFFCVHWFSGPPTILKRLIDIDCYFSCGPALEYSPKHQLVAKLVPINRLLTESDGNVKYQGKVGHPGLIPDVVAHITSLTRHPKDEVSRMVFKNAYEYLRMPAPNST